MEHKDKDETRECEGVVMSSSTETHEDVVALVLHDHQRIERMLEAFPGIAESERELAFRGLVATLVAHEIAEEQSVYPTLRHAAAGGDAIAHDRIAEQAVTEVLLRDLEKTPIGDPEILESVPPLGRRRTHSCPGRGKDDSLGA